MADPQNLSIAAAMDESLVTYTHVIYRVIHGWLALRDRRPTYV